MKSYMTRHQTFLPEEMSRQLEHLAKSSRARSETLVEALDPRFSLRQAPKSDEVIGIRLIRIKRNTGWLRCNQARLRKVLGQMVVASARNPLRKVARAASAKLFAQLIAEIADRFAGNAALANDDPTT